MSISNFNCYYKDYKKYLKNTNNLRWRIEHAQIVDTNDLYFFKKYSSK